MTGSDDAAAGTPWSGAVGSRLKERKIKAGLKSGITTNISVDLEAIRAQADVIHNEDPAARVRQALERFRAGGGPPAFRDKDIPAGNLRTSRSQEMAQPSPVPQDLPPLPETVAQVAISPGAAPVAGTTRTPDPQIGSGADLETPRRNEQAPAADHAHTPQKPAAGGARAVDRNLPTAPDEILARFSGIPKQPPARKRGSREIAKYRDAQQSQLKPLSESESESEADVVYKVPGGRFFCRSSRSGLVTSFWVPGSRKGEPPHYKWTGTGYRRFKDETGEFDSRSPSVLYPQARIDSRQNAVRVAFGDGDVHVFGFDGRFEERDLQDRLLQDGDGKGLRRRFVYEDDSMVGVRVHYENEPVTAIFSFDPNDPSTRKLAGYEFRHPETGHLETLEKDLGYWKLKVGDRIYWFPDECALELDRHGDRKLRAGNRVFFQGHHDGRYLVRDTSGFVVEVMSPCGVLTVMTRNERGQIGQLFVISGQGQVVEHSTFDGLVWDSPDLIGIRCDDATGTIAVRFAGGQEVRRHTDGTQELVGATDDYKLDADRVLDYVPVADDERRRVKADLAVISRFDLEVQSWIYNAIWELSAAEGCPTRLSESQRRELVLSLIHQLAHPEDIRQGYKDSIVAVVGEKTLSMLRPDLYATMLVRLAVTGEFATAGGIKVWAQRRSDGSLADYSDSSQERSVASEVLQTSMLNMVMPRGQEYRSYPAGHEPVPVGVDRSLDAGERVFELGKESRFFGPPKDALLNLLSCLMPEDRWTAVPLLSGKDLEAAWQQNGYLPPLPVSVRIDVPDPHSGTAPHTHAVIVTYLEYDEAGKAARVFFENTADGEDHSYPGGTGVPINEFVRAMQVRSSNVITGTETVIPVVAMIRTLSFPTGEGG